MWLLYTFVDTTTEQQTTGNPPFAPLTSIYVVLYNTYLCTYNIYLLLTLCITSYILFIFLYTPLVLLKSCTYFLFIFLYTPLVLLKSCTYLFLHVLISFPFFMYMDLAVHNLPCSFPPLFFLYLCGMFSMPFLSKIMYHIVYNIYCLYTTWYC